MKTHLIFSFAIHLLAGNGFLKAAEPPVNVSGVYPHLRMWNDHGESGTGALVPWQGELWAITYAPHMPGGSTDKLYRITPDLEQIIFEGSVGGTPANRMIHLESNQLLIGPYLVDAEKNIRVIPPEKMYGRLTGTARHLTDPSNKVYYATMEEGLYEVDVNTLEITTLIRDGHEKAPKEGVESDLPGYHGKGLFTGQGRLVYSNNGEKSTEARRDPTIDSGALAEWFGEGAWQLVRRNQFTEVSGPGGIIGNENPETDPLWAMGWDQKSLILALLDNKEWHYYRIPKGSHSYDGSHGWNTEWPRIREIGEENLLATMHGTFWHFPASFSRSNSAGIAPRSNYLKVIGDFCRWGDRLVLGCDDSAKAEFLNTRPFKAEHGAPKQSNSNLWFIEPEKLDDLGPAIGRGSVWLREEIEAGLVSDPYLFSGYDYRQLHLVHHSDSAVDFTLEVDKNGTNDWTPLRTLTLPPKGSLSYLFPKEETGTWVRIKSGHAAKNVTANFQYREADPREETNHELFRGLTTTTQSSVIAGVMRSLAYDKLGLVTTAPDDSSELQYYELNSSMELTRVENPKAAGELLEAVRQPENSIQIDKASVIIIEDGKRYRLPRNDAYVTPTMKSETAISKVLEDYLDTSLSRGASVEVSSVHSHYESANLVDGVIDEESRWIGKKGEQSSATLDLGSEKTFQSLWVVSGLNRDASFVARDFDLQIKDGDTWKTLSGGEIRGNRDVEREIEFDAPVSAQYLRILARDDDFFRLYELAAFVNSPEISKPALQGLGSPRICREVATERDLLNIHGTFYELPARNAQGLAKVRPIATHYLAIQDFCSHNGLLFFTGIDAETESEHIFRSDDGHAAIWAGVIDDLWKLGKPRGKGGPWAGTDVAVGDISDPYLMTAYDEKSVEITSTNEATIRLEVDVDGTGLWIPYMDFAVAPEETVKHQFEDGFSAYWVRAVSDAVTTASVIFEYR